MSENTLLEAPDFRAVFRELPGLYLLLTTDLRIIAASKAYLRSTGRTEEIIGRSLFETFPDSAANGYAGARALAHSFNRVLTTQVADSMPLQRYDLLRADGSSELRYWSPINAPVFDEAGRLRWLLHRVSDVTPAVVEGARDPLIAELDAELQDSAQRSADGAEALRDSETRLRLALDIGGMAVWQYRIGDARLTITPELNRLIGFPASHATTTEQVSDGFIDEAETIRVAARRAREAGRSVFEHQFRYRRHDDGRCVWLHLRAEIRRDANGRPAEVLGVLEDVTERVAAQERQRTLIHELNHRVKNNLALVQSLAVRTFRGRGCDEALDHFVKGLIGLAGAHELLTRTHWAGAMLADVVEASLRDVGIPRERRAFRGADVRLTADLALSLSLALHELATNAIKHGALANDTGRVEVSGSLEEPGPRLVIEWREQDGPPVRVPERHGFGSQLLSRIFAGLGGGCRVTYAPEGVVCRMEIEARSALAPP